MNTWQRLLEETRSQKRVIDGQYDLRMYWRGKGFIQHEGQPDTLLRAHAFADVLRQIPCRLSKNDLLAGSSLGFTVAQLPDSLDETEYQRIKQIHDAKGLRTFWSGIDHTLADYRTLCRIGISGYRAQVCESLQTHTAQKETDFLNSVQITLDAFSDFIRRYLGLAVQTGQTDMAERLHRIADEPPRTFHEAIQLVWLTHLVFLTEGRSHMALGRIDQYLYPFYQTDIREGRMTEAQALELICHLWVKLDAIGHVQNICIGGLTPEGTDGVNEISYLCLEATRLVQTPHANLSARFHEGTPDRFHYACIDVIKTGIGFPAIFNDHVIVEGLVQVGVPPEIARDHCYVGCIEIMLAGRQQAWGDSRFNIPLCLSEALDSMKTANDRSYERLIELFKESHAQRLREYAASIISHIARYPVERYADPFLSALTRDCIGRARDINDGGAEFPRFHGVAGMGLANVADSLAAVKKLVFETGTLSFDSLMQAIDADFEGYEPIRQMLINQAPKYGNNDPYVDTIAAWVVELFTRECMKLTIPGGGRFFGCMAANVSNIYAGKDVKATPDGRKAFTPLSDAASPFFGRDMRGPTAFIGSVATPDYTPAFAATVINMKFEPSYFEGEEGTRRFAAITKTFVRKRIQELQFNFTGNDTLMAAQKEPEKYRNLIVRVSGFSAYFVTLAADVQADIIRRRAHQNA